MENILYLRILNGFVDACWIRGLHFVNVQHILYPIVRWNFNPV